MEELIRRKELKDRFYLRTKWCEKDMRDQYTLGIFHGAEYDAKLVDEIPAVDAIEVSKVEEAKQELLNIVDEFIAEYRNISQSYVDHFGGKADAMETAKRLINAKLTDLCRKD